MSKFIYGHALNASVEAIIREAEEWLLLVSPFIKLNHRYLDELRGLKKRPHCRVLICFGKSEGKYHKSFDPEALRFLKEMPNVKIVYDERLHAKFYANEKRSLLTSMNLYDYSQINNIEVGVESIKGNFMSRSGLDAESWNYFSDVIDAALVVFNREPKFKKAMMGLTENYEGSETKVDEIEVPQDDDEKKTSGGRRSSNGAVQTGGSSGFSAKPPQDRAASQAPGTGYCIRTGVQIPFNVERPLSDRAFNSWVQFGDGTYPEAYCHFTGEQSFGETCYERPILRKNWNKAKKWIQ